MYRKVTICIKKKLQFGLTNKACTKRWMSKFWESSCSRTICRKDTHSKAPIPLLRKIQRANKRVLGWSKRKITQISAVHAKFMAWPTQPRRATCLITKTIISLLVKRVASSSHIDMLLSSWATKIGKQVNLAGKALSWSKLNRITAEKTVWWRF